MTAITHAVIDPQQQTLVAPLAKKPNYNYEKQKKELEKKLKREEKTRRKREMREATQASPVPDEDPKNTSE